MQKNYKSSFYCTLLVFNACFGAFNMGYCFSYVSLAFKTIFKVLDIPKEDETAETGLISVMVTIGALVGAFLSRYFLLFFTRKTSLIIADVIGVTSFLTLIPNREIIILFRLFLGLSNGISIGILPTYLREICPDSLYQKLSMLIEGQVSLGLLGGQLMGIGFAYDSLSDETSPYWQIVFAIPGIISCLKIILTFVFFNYDSPLSQLLQNNQEEARRVRIINHFYLEEYQEQVYQDQLKELEKLRKTKESIAELLTKKMRFRLFTGFMVTFFQQWGGIVTIFTYGGQIFNEITNDDILLSTIFTIFIGVVKCISSGVSIYLVTLFGRKTILIGGSSIMAISYTLISILIYTQPSGGQTASAIIIYLTVLFFGFSYGPIPYSIIGEVLNMVGVWLSVVNLWANMAILVFVFPYMIDGMGIAGAFLFFVGTNIASIICIGLLLKETKGLNPQQIDQLFESNKVQDEDKGQNKVIAPTQLDTNKNEEEEVPIK